MMLVKYINKQSFIFSLNFARIQCNEIKKCSLHSPNKECWYVFKNGLFTVNLRNRSTSERQTESGGTILARKFYYIRAHNARPGQADTWTGNYDLPLFGKVNSSIKLNRPSRLRVATLRKPSAVAFMNRRALRLRLILACESRHPIPRRKTKSSHNRLD